MFDTIWTSLSQSIGPLATVLLIGNFWLIKEIRGLKSNIEKRVDSQDFQMQGMAKEIAGLKEVIEQLTRDFKDVGALRERIAVLEAMVRRDA